MKTQHLLMIISGKGEHFFKVPRGGIKRLGDPNEFVNFQLEGLLAAKRKKMEGEQSMGASPYGSWEGLTNADNDEDDDDDNDDDDYEDNRDIDEPSEEWRVWFSQSYTSHTLLCT